jgi:hypothetical protein
LYRIIFQADTRAGRMFDVFLLWAILLSVLATMLQSSRTINAEYGELLTAIEWSSPASSGRLPAPHPLSEKTLRYCSAFSGSHCGPLLPSFVVGLRLRQHS